MICHSMRENKEMAVMFIIKLLEKILAVIGIIILSGLCLGVKVLENLGTRIAGFILTILGVLAFMAVISSNWFALTVFGVLAVCVVVVLFGTATLEALIELGRDAMKGCLKKNKFDWF